MNSLSVNIAGVRLFLRLFPSFCPKTKKSVSSSNSKYIYKKYTKITENKTGKINRHIGICNYIIFKQNKQIHTVKPNKT